MKTNYYSILTSLLAILGSYLIGQTIFGAQVDASLWGTIVGGALAVAGLVMSVLDKSLTIEKTQAFMRTVIMAIGGLLIAAGKLTEARLEIWLGFVTAITPMLYTFFAKKKSQLIETGEIKVEALKK